MIATLKKWLIKARTRETFRHGRAQNCTEQFERLCRLGNRMKSAVYGGCAIALLGSMAVASGVAEADENAKRYFERDSVKAYIEQISEEQDLDVNRISALFTDLERQQSILDAISRPAERSLTWREYRPIFVTQKRIDGGKAFLAEHTELLKKAEEKFGVPASIITAIIGVETYYGGNTGSYGVLEALATLSFDYPRRSDFFSREMTEFIVLSEAEGWDTVNVLGSYAGAMGMPQFIASSYREYAIDFDDDGRRDLFSSHADIIGSVGNYLARHGWVENAPIAERWITDNGITQPMREFVRESLLPAIDADSVRSQGFDSSQLAQGTQDDRLLSVMTMAGEQGDELWVGYRNFYAITRYNHSRLYAMAVYQLAEAIGSSTH